MNCFTPCLPAVASTEDASNGYRGQSVTTSWSSWRFPFDFLFWDWHASHYIEVSSFFSNRLDCHYLKRLVPLPPPPLICPAEIPNFTTFALSLPLLISVRFFTSCCLYLCYGSFFCCHAESNLNFLLST